MRCMAIMRKLITRRRLIIAACVACGLLLLGSWLVGGVLLAAANHVVGPPPDEWDGVEVTTIASQSGSQLAAWYWPAADAFATVVLLHPIRGDRTTMIRRAAI